MKPQLLHQKESFRKLEDHLLRLLVNLLFQLDALIVQLFFVELDFLGHVLVLGKVSHGLVKGEVRNLVAL